jgi:hypothetical protein
MALNVKPDKRDNMVTRDPDKSLTYPVYSFSSSATQIPIEIDIETDITILGLGLKFRFNPMKMVTLTYYTLQKWKVNNLFFLILRRGYG